MRYPLVALLLASGLAALGLFHGSSHTATTIEPNLDTKAEANQMLRQQPGCPTWGSGITRRGSCTAAVR